MVLHAICIGAFLGQAVAADPNIRVDSLLHAKVNDAKLELSDSQMPGCQQCDCDWIWMQDTSGQMREVCAKTTTTTTTPDPSPVCQGADAVTKANIADPHLNHGPVLLAYRYSDFYDMVACDTFNCTDTNNCAAGCSYHFGTTVGRPEFLTHATISGYSHVYVGPVVNGEGDPNHSGPEFGSYGGARDGNIYKFNCLAGWTNAHGQDLYTQGGGYWQNGQMRHGQAQLNYCMAASLCSTPLRPLS